MGFLVRLLKYVRRKVNATILVNRSFVPNDVYFEEIYRHNLFGDSSSVSGPGSTLESTKTIRKSIIELFEDYKIKSIADIPCGDLFWFSTLDVSKLDYTGLDIVPELIEDLKKRYPARKFKLHDAASHALEKYDLIFCRDLFVHLTNTQIVQALELFKKSGTNFLLTTTFVERKKNTELRVPKNGVGWRPLNLAITPFNLGEPITIILENCTEGRGKFTDKSLGLWRLN